MIVRALPSLDRIAIALSGLCVVHCLATTALIAAMSAAGALGSPIVHEVGLALAIGLGALALGRGVLTHRRLFPAIAGALGIAMMAVALAMPHGGSEAAWTIAGVTLLAGAHLLNHRGCTRARRR